MNKKYIYIGICLVIVWLSYLFFTSTFFYYLNANKNISIANAEKIKRMETSTIELDYIIQDGTIYYYSKKNKLFFNHKAYIYKSDINSKKVEKVCKFDVNNAVFSYGFVYKNKLYYKENVFEHSFNKEGIFGSSNAVIKRMDLNDCSIKEVFKYKYDSFEYDDNLKKPENNILEVIYSEDGAVVDVNKSFTYDMDKEKLIKTSSTGKDYGFDGKIYHEGKMIYNVAEDEYEVEVLFNDDNYIYYYNELEADCYINKLDIKSKKVVNKVKVPGDEVIGYDNGYFYSNKKLYKYNYDNDKVEVVLNKVVSDAEYSELYVVNDKYIFLDIDDAIISTVDDKPVFESTIFIYDSDGKLLFKENQNEYTNTLRNAIVDGNNLYVVYSDGTIKTLDLSKM